MKTKVSTRQLREMFLNYFANNQHVIMPASSLIPHQDPSLLFVNSGMVQFKTYFLGEQQPPYSRVTTVQKCMRAGGKHNDLSLVGYTTRHLTMFEMLGNFSFNAYFKDEAIRLAWHMCIDNLQLDKERIIVTVHISDEEAYKLWQEIAGLPVSQIIKVDSNDNFWQMGEEGLCGPCTEIYYKINDNITPDPISDDDVVPAGYLEIWNLVFMQYNRIKTVTGYELHEIPALCVDTGMGLERLCMIINNENDVYSVDTLATIVQNIYNIVKDTTIIEQNKDTIAAPRVIADHIRSACFLIADGVCPGNEGREFVLRKIIRRAIRYGYKITIKEPFLYKLVEIVVNLMGDVYPELIKNQEFIAQTIFAEEQRYLINIYKTQPILEEFLLQAANNSKRTLYGDDVFLLYDTYGVPLDTIIEASEEYCVNVDLVNFETYLTQQKLRAHAMQKNTKVQKIASQAQTTQFVGYDVNEVSTQIIDIRKTQTQNVYHVITAQSPFYPESGGQIGDTGWMVLENDVSIAVVDTQKADKAIVHIVQCSTHEQCELIEAMVNSVSHTVVLSIDLDKRRKIAAHHTVTHLLHAALKQVVGIYAIQKGSYVGPDKLRFDFTTTEPLTQENLTKIETIVNNNINDHLPVYTFYITKDTAINSGAIGLFGENYTPIVRVVKINQANKCIISYELCGGTHVKNTSSLICFKITNETSVGTGIRRIEAVAGNAALDFYRAKEMEIATVYDLLKHPIDSYNTISTLLENNNLLTKQLNDMSLMYYTTFLTSNTVTVKNIHCMTAVIPDITGKQAYTLTQRIAKKYDNAIVVIITNEIDSTSLLTKAIVTIAIHHKLATIYTAKAILMHYLSLLQSSHGGGKVEHAQGSGCGVINNPLEILTIYIEQH